ncbi:hypothetical protein [Lamprobacter modestohalophilus]|uniref:hypothetical protein n=1 Tax=Lamprobacter modestohalophilus TaxID=1064514 RepID=UPI001F5B45A9|nr:hypothetical protein [Lamprobacter modestohalophilus]
MTDKRRIPWHDLLGKALADALIGLPYRVSTEEELALRSQDSPSAPRRARGLGRAQSAEL